MNFTVELNIDASDKNELAEKLTAFSKLNQILQHEDLINTVEVLKQKPQIVDIVKEFADDTDLQNLNVFEIAQKIPTIIKKLKQ